jgi:hypothetical protein
MKGNSCDIFFKVISWVLPRETEENQEMFKHNWHQEMTIHVLLVICVLEKCDFILIRSTNLDWFQLIALALMQITCRPIETVGEDGVEYCVGQQRRNTRGEGDILFDLCEFTLCNPFFFGTQLLHKSMSTCTWSHGSKSHYIWCTGNTTLELKFNFEVLVLIYLTCCQLQIISAADSTLNSLTNQSEGQGIDSELSRKR